MFNFNSHRENYAIITDGGEYFSYKQLEFTLGIHFAEIFEIKIT